MVYCGKPSPSCALCRKRRIKCDRRDPSCSQCLNKSMQCPGYPNLLDLAFRDQTTAVVKKFHADERKSKSRKASPAARVGSPTVPLSQPIQELALCHFLNTYAAGSHFDYLPMLYGKTAVTSPLLFATYATGLANLSRDRQEPDLIRTARKFYSQALQETNQALQSKDAKLDSTLASVLVLSLFESIVLDGELSLTNWETHVDGSLSLLAMRGVESLKTEIGQKLYIHVSNNIRVSYAQRATPLPPKFVELDKQASQYLDMSLPALQFWPIADAFVTMQVLEMNKYQYEPMDLIKLGTKMETMLVDLAARVDGAWGYEVLEPEDAPAEAFEGYAHRYSSHLIPRLWNTIRMSRLFVNEVLWEYAGIMKKSSSPEDVIAWTNMQETAIFNAKEMAREILASIPQFIRRPKTEKSPLRITTVSGFVWPLSAAGRCTLLTPEMRRYALDALHIIGTEAKLVQASKIANVLENRSVPLYWLHVFHLA